MTRFVIKPLAEELVPIAVFPLGVFDVTGFDIKADIVRLWKVFNDVAGTASDIEHTEPRGGANPFFYAETTRTLSPKYALEPKIELGVLENIAQAHSKSNRMIASERNLP